MLHVLGIRLKLLLVEVDIEQNEREKVQTIRFWRNACLPGG